MATTGYLARVLLATADRLSDGDPGAPLTDDVLTGIVFTEAWHLVDLGHDVYGHELARAALSTLPPAPERATRSDYAQLIRQAGTTLAA